MQIIKLIPKGGINPEEINPSSFYKTLAQVGVINDDVILINDKQYLLNSLTFEVGGDSGGIEVKMVKLLIPSAQVLQLNSNPIELIPAEGGKAAEVLSAIFKMNYNSTPYTGNTQINIETETAPAPQFYSVQQLGANGNIFESVKPLQDGGLITLIENKKIRVFVPGGNPINGNSDITIYATYRIVDL